MKALDAPVYAPARAYTPPKRLPVELSTHTYSITALTDNPTTLAIVLKFMPQMKMIISSRDRRVFFTTTTFRDLAADTPAVFPPAALDKIDAELVKLPKAEWPRNED
jgi:hypothetical protein